jgi:hypothetical protein
VAPAAVSEYLHWFELFLTNALVVARNGGGMVAGAQQQVEVSYRMTVIRHDDSA